jgi:hypothetical protein
MIAIRGTTMLWRVGLLGLLLSVAPWCLAQEAAMDDGWRRTDGGWEHIATWNLPHAPAATSRTHAWREAIRTSRWDQWLLHPGWLAFGMLVLAGAGLAMPNVYQRPPMTVESEV